MSEQTPTLIQRALDLARNGYYVLPLTPGDKKPLTEHGSNDATRDEETIRAWWRHWPNANVGFSLDKTGLVDIAPDCPEWAEQFKTKGMPHTTLYTSGGGAGHWHALYRLPRGGPVARINVSKQYDIMSQGNAVAPGSIHPSGRTYTAVTPILAVENLPIAPDWAIALLAEKQARSAPDAHDSADWSALPKGDALAQSRRFLALCKANDQLRAVCAGEAVVLTTKSGGKDGSTSIQRSVFVNQLIRAKYPHAEIRALALHFSGVLESDPQRFGRDIDRLLRIYTPADYAPQPTGTIASAPAAPRGGRHYEITASDMLDRYHEHADCGPAGIILDWTIEDAAQRLGVSTGTIKRREAELTEAGRIRRDYRRVILEPAEIRSQPFVMRQSAPIVQPEQASIVPAPSRLDDDPLIGSQSIIAQPNAENPPEIAVCVEHAHVEVTHFPANHQVEPPALATVAEARPGALAPGECVLSAPAGAPDPRAGWRVVRLAGRWALRGPKLECLWFGSEGAALQALASIGRPAQEAPAGWCKVAPGFDDSAEPELASFDAAGVRVLAAEPIAAPVVVELDPLELAPPLPDEPTYGDFIWRYHAQRPGSIDKRTGKARAQSQRDRFRRDMQRYMVEVSPEEAVLRWLALKSLPGPGVRARAGAPPARLSHAQRPQAAPNPFIGQASLFDAPRGVAAD